MKHLGVLSDKISKPEGYESSDGEQVRSKMIRDNEKPAVDESVMEMKRLMAKAGNSNENSLEFLQSEVNKAIEQVQTLQTRFM